MKYLREATIRSCLIAGMGIGVVTFAVVEHTRCGLVITFSSHITPVDGVLDNEWKTQMNAVLATVSHDMTTAQEGINYNTQALNLYN